MRIQDLKDMQSVLKHYLELTKARFRNDGLRRIATFLLEKINKKLIEINDKK